MSSAQSPSLHTFGDLAGESSRGGISEVGTNDQLGEKKDSGDGVRVAVKSSMGFGDFKKVNWGTIGARMAGRDGVDGAGDGSS